MEQRVLRLFVRPRDHEFERCFAQDASSEDLISLANTRLRHGQHVMPQHREHSVNQQTRLRAHRGGDYSRSAFFVPVTMPSLSSSAMLEQVLLTAYELQEMSSYPSSRVGVLRRAAASTVRHFGDGPSRVGLPAKYAASFRTGFSALAKGALVVEEHRLLLEGRSDQGRVQLSILYSEINDVLIDRRPEKTPRGHAALLVSRKNGELLHIEPVGFGLLFALADLLSILASEHADPNEQVVVVLPLRKGRVSRARELVGRGPPFDPAALGLKRHEVYLTDEEAIFTFQGPRVRGNLERLTRDPTLWQAGLGWRSCVGGRPRLLPETTPPRGAPVFSWTADER